MKNIHRPERFACSGTEVISSKPTVYERLDSLSQVQDQFGLRHSTISVLRALCSFLPNDTRQGENGRTVVWPSNEVLSERSNGMPERTLRRQLEKLVDAGLIIRHDSANRKRFALRIKGSPVIAFGFDLSPFLDRVDEIQEMCATKQDAMERIAVLRAQVRSMLSSKSIDEGQRQHIAIMLRRKLTIDDLERVATELHSVEIVTAKMAARDGENGLHIQNTNKEIYYVESKKLVVKSIAHKTIEISECLNAISEAMLFAPKPITSWHELKALAERLGPMIGINLTLFQRAISVMGNENGSLALLCIIQIYEQLRSPAAYFTTLIHRAQKGAFSMKGLISMASRANIEKMRFTGAN